LFFLQEGRYPGRLSPIPYPFYVGNVTILGWSDDRSSLTATTRNRTVFGRRGTLTPKGPINCLSAVGSRVVRTGVVSVTFQLRPIPGSSAPFTIPFRRFPGFTTSSLLLSPVQHDGFTITIIREVISGGVFHPEAHTGHPLLSLCLPFVSCRTNFHGHDTGKLRWFSLFIGSLGCEP